MDQGNVETTSPHHHHRHGSHRSLPVDKKIQNLNTMLNSLQQQLVSEKLQLRKTQTLLTSKRQLVQSSHALLERDFQGVFTDGPIKHRRRTIPGRPLGLVSLLEPSAPEDVAAMEHGQETPQVTVTAWHSLNDDVIWVQAHVRNTLKTPLYNVQLQTSHGLTRRSTATVLQVDVEIDVCATYQLDPVHDVKQLDDLHLVYSFSDSGPNHCQRLTTGHVQDRSDLKWLMKVKSGVPPSLYVYFAHWISVVDENEMDQLRQIGKMQHVANSVWISDDQSLVAVKSGNQNEVGCVDGMKLERLVSRIQEKQVEA